MPRRVPQPLALQALAFFASEDARPKHVEERMPRGVGIQTVFALADGGFLDDAPGNCFAITENGRKALEAGALDWADVNSSPAPSPAADEAFTSRQGPPLATRRKERSTPFVSQAQIVAVLKAARSEGASVEIRFEKHSVRVAVIPNDRVSEDGT